MKDLIVNRKELRSWQKNLVWGKDGTLYLNTSPHITIAQPRFEKEVNGNSKNLFHLKEFPLELESNNKLEFEFAERNTLLNSQPISYVRYCEPSLGGNNNNLLAVLTSNGNVCIFENDVLVANLDDSAAPLAGRIYHSLHWNSNLTANGEYITLGNELGQLVIFQKGNSDNSFHLLKTINLVSDCLEWITSIVEDLSLIHI